MRYEMCNHIASSAMNAFRMMQEVVDAPNLHQVAKAHAAAGKISPNLNGCVDSPEAATMVLMLVGTVGIYFGSALFLKLARKRNNVAAL